jgi:hypothetical protein
MNKVVIGGLYQCSYTRELWKQAEKQLPSAVSSKVLVGHIQSNTPFVVLEQRIPKIKHAAFREYRDLKVLTTNGEIAWMYCYLSDLEEITG